MPTAGRLSERIGSRPVTLAALLGGGAALVLTAVAGGLVGLSAALFLFGAGFGAVNVAANAQGIALERLSERSILSSFHAAFSFGGLAGAGLGASPPRPASIRWSISARSRSRQAERAVPEGAFAAQPTIGSRLDSARPQLALVLGAAAFFTPIRGSRRLERRLPSDSLCAGAAAAALGYTAFHLQWLRAGFGDRLNTRLPVAPREAGLAASAPHCARQRLHGCRAAGSAMRPGVVVPVLFRAAGSTPACSLPPASPLSDDRLVRLRRPAGDRCHRRRDRPAQPLAIAVTMVALALASANPAPPGLPRPHVRAGAVLSDMDGVLVDSWVAIERRGGSPRRYGSIPRSFSASHGTIDVFDLRRT
jgi:hypothetical protein